jgi:hypothetical protein
MHFCESIPQWWTGKKKPQRAPLGFSQELNPGDVLLSHGEFHTIIGAEQFHF